MEEEACLGLLVCLCHSLNALVLQAVCGVLPIGHPSLSSQQPLGIYHCLCFTNEEPRQRLSDLLKVATFRNVAGPGMVADFGAWVFHTASCSFL